MSLRLAPKIYHRFAIIRQLKSSEFIAPLCLHRDTIPIGVWNLDNLPYVLECSTLHRETYANATLEVVVAFLSGTGKIASLLLAGILLLQTGFAKDSTRADNVVIRWNDAALQGIRDSKLGAPMVARALAIVHTCIYDAWAAYDERAIGTQLQGALRRPASERTLGNKEEAISYASYRALVDVLPVDTNSVYIPLMKQLGYD